MRPSAYTHSVIDLGASACRCALGSVFPIEKKRRPSRSRLSFLIDAYRDVGSRATQEHRCRGKTEDEMQMYVKMLKSITLWV
ncbi:hypothetical protein MNBD_GAMMA16-1208 [hydrothermal vent metagenome]|uniref:Uncharacterized protein n=1 Tax=hydrothermal vent metagenome TaxID=652676 RepID=A0A3B0Z688_9ZZZZ